MLRSACKFSSSTYASTLTRCESPSVQRHHRLGLSPWSIDISADTWNTRLAVAGLPLAIIILVALLVYFCCAQMLHVHLSHHGPTAVTTQTSIPASEVGDGGFASLVLMDFLLRAAILRRRFWHLGSAFYRAR